ncbi:cell adhesion molecule [Clonorchis sinensis]|uniref:Cell adhesion molecule n=1 Tax=Clonorchis sinensis TaxID=79923 RepID=G7Y4S0_CLOSI|nr:cell adhesion molecule [Clonorchis sinensis]
MVIVGQDGVVFLRRPQNQTVMETTPLVSFDCQAITTSPVTSYTWRKNGNDVEFSVDFQHRYVIHSNGSLQIRKVNRHDSGQFTCHPQTKRLKNGEHPGSDNRLNSFFMGTNSSTNNLIREDEALQNSAQSAQATAYLTVHFIPDAFGRKRHPTYLGFNGPGRISCNIIASPPVEKVEWRKMDTVNAHTNPMPVITPNRSKQRWPMLFDAGQLARTRDQNSDAVTYWYEWDSVVWEDAGFYQCRGRSRLGWSAWSEKFEIIVAAPPTFSLRPPDILAVHKNSLVRLQCQADGFPPPKIKWVLSRPSAFQNDAYYTNIDGSEGVQHTAQDDSLIDDTGKLVYNPTVSHTIAPSLPRTAEVATDGSLRLLVTEPTDVEGLFHCIAVNVFGHVISTVRLLYSNSSSGENEAREILFHVQPKLFGVWISWNASNTLDSRLRKATSSTPIEQTSLHHSANSPGVQACSHVIYYRIIRSEDRWNSVRVQPTTAENLWVGSLIPDEIYAFKMERWCKADAPSGQSKVVVVKTEPEDSPGSKFNAFLLDTPDSPLQTNPPLPRPMELHLLFPKTFDQWTSGNQEDAYEHFVLEWEADPATKVQTSVTPVLHYRVEYSLRMANISGRVSNLTSDNPTNVLWSFDSMDRWLTLAPVHAPVTKFSFAPTEDVDDQQPYQKHLEELRFRVRSYGLMSRSEPSEELRITQPVLGKILPALKATVHREHIAIERVLHAETAFTSPSEKVHHNTMNDESTITTPSSVGALDTLWYTLSYSLLGSLLLSLLLLLILYGSRRIRLHRSNKQRTSSSQKEAIALKNRRVPDSNVSASSSEQLMREVNMLHPSTKPILPNSYKRIHFKKTCLSPDPYNWNNSSCLVHNDFKGNAQFEGLHLIPVCCHSREGNCESCQSNRYGHSQTTIWKDDHYLASLDSPQTSISFASGNTNRSTNLVLLDKPDNACTPKMLRQVNDSFQSDSTASKRSDEPSEVDYESRLVSDSTKASALLDLLVAPSASWIECSYGSTMPVASPHLIKSLSAPPGAAVMLLPLYTDDSSKPLELSVLPCETYPLPIVTPVASPKEATNLYQTYCLVAKTELSEDQPG